MPSLDARLLALGQQTDNMGELPIVVHDDCSDAELGA